MLEMSRVSDNDDDDVVSLNKSNESSKSTSPLTDEQRSRMETNRKRALEIRKQKEESAAKIAKLNEVPVQKRMIDSGAGFYMDEEDLIEERKKEEKVSETPQIPPMNQHLTCEKCNKKFPHSFLSLKFDLNVCDTCRTQNEEDYKLITRTEAKTKYLLKDCDLDSRDPPLKYLLKKNPHHSNWGEMKLYVALQCRQRALEVHEDLDTLEEKKEMRIANVQRTKQKNFEKKLKELRKETRQTTKKPIQFHEHEFGPEKHNKKDDTCYKICKTCSYKLIYEDM